VSKRSSNGAAEEDHGSSEETDTTVDNPLFRTTESRPTATFGPAVAKHPPMEEPTDATVPRLEPTVPMISRRAVGRSWTALGPALAIGGLLVFALVAAYASCR
jgi:hypothetical protein